MRRTEPPPQTFKRFISNSLPRASNESVLYAIQDEVQQDSRARPTFRALVLGVRTDICAWSPFFRFLRNLELINMRRNDVAGARSPEWPRRVVIPCFRDKISTHAFLVIEG
jgi:hypothetical protein